MRSNTHTNWYCECFSLPNLTKYPNISTPRYFHVWLSVADRCQHEYVRIFSFAINPIEFILPDVYWTSTNFKNRKEDSIIKQSIFKNIVRFPPIFILFIHFIYICWVRLCASIFLYFHSSLWWGWSYFEKLSKLD